LPVPGMAMLFRRDLLRVADWRRRPPSHLFTGDMIFHDEWIYGLARVVGRVVFLPDRLALHRRHGQTVTATPLHGWQSRARAAATTGRRYYEARAQQARAWSDILAAAARTEADPVRRNRLENGRASFSELADGLALRAG